MKKLSLSLLAAGVMAVAGMAQADVIFYPDGTSVELGENGADNLALSSSDSMSSMDTTVLGAGPSTTTVTTTGPVVMEYVQPNINWDRGVALKQLHSNAHLMRHHDRMDRSAAATFNTPTRAGEASTMTSGAPNLVTNNDRVVVGSYMIPYTAVGSSPYYVFSY
jgi:hypothetical protein